MLFIQKWLLLLYKEKLKLLLKEEENIIYIQKKINLMITIKIILGSITNQYYTRIKIKVKLKLLLLYKIESRFKTTNIY